VTVSLSATDYTAEGNTSLANYVLPTEITGNVGVITPAVLTVTANNDSKIYDRNPYSGGNGVTYNGFVNGDKSSVLGGTLSYGGTSQGAVIAGNYTIIPSGLTSGNYNISFVNGSLTIVKYSCNVYDMYQIIATEHSWYIKTFKGQILPGLKNDRVFKPNDRNWTIGENYFIYPKHKDRDKKSRKRHKS
jgi:hypothetical protein